MSRRTLINGLVDNGYEPGILDQLNHSELCLLVQNEWSEIARQRAAQMRKAGHKKVTPAKAMVHSTRSFIRGTVGRFHVPNTKAGGLSKKTAAGKKLRKGLADEVRALRAGWAAQDKARQGK